MVTLSSRPGSVYGSRPTSPAVRSAGPSRGGAVPFTDLNSGKYEKFSYQSLSLFLFFVLLPLSISPAVRNARSSPYFSFFFCLLGVGVKQAWSKPPIQKNDTLMIHMHNMFLFQERYRPTTEARIPTMPRCPSANLTSSLALPPP